MKRHLFAAFAAALALLSVSCTTVKVDCLTCDGLRDPLGIDNTAPHFSWKVYGDIPAITSYQIQVSSSISSLLEGDADRWDSGKVKSVQSVMIPYQGADLHSGDECFWRVKVWHGCSSSGWSAPARFSVGLIEGLPGDFIGAFEGCDISPRFRSSFEADEGEEIFVHVNSLGYHELYVNGRKVGDAVLSPAVSQLDKRSLTMTYDVSDEIVTGTNEIEIWAGKGWYTRQAFDAVYHGPLVKSAVQKKNAAGCWETILVTDSTWTATDTGYRSPGKAIAWEFGGEVIDAGKFESGEEARVDAVKVEGIVETPVMCQPNVIADTIRPVSVTRLDDSSCFVRDLGPSPTGYWLVDMGRSLLAQVEYYFPRAAAGNLITAFYADRIREDGILEKDSFLTSGREGGDRFRNRFCHHAFRYVILTGCENEPDPGDITAYTLRPDYEDASSFRCSDKDMNDIHDLVKYTLSVLTFSGYQVDCPHIERLGYGGDGNSSTMTTQTMFDAAPLYYNWLNAWGDVIRPDGSLPHTAPSPVSAGGGPYWCGFIIMAPYRTLLNYGDSRMAEKLYDKMHLWLSYVDKYSVDGLLKRWPDTDYRGWYLGDWIAPDGIDVTDSLSIDIVNNCSLSQNLAALRELAVFHGREEDARAIDERRRSLNSMIHRKFFNPEDSTYASRSELDMLYPLLVGAVPDSLHDAVRVKMMQRSSDIYDNHIAEGLVGIPVLADWAVKDNCPDFVYQKLKQRDCPGYLYMIDNDGTTTWEYWKGNRSYIHNCFNGIGSWFYQALGGILPEEPGYRTFSINPQIPSGIISADVTKETPYGTVEVHWSIAGKRISYEISVPVGATARFTDASGDVRLLKAGRRIFSAPYEN